MLNRTSPYGQSFRPCGHSHDLECCRLAGRVLPERQNPFFGGITQMGPIGLPELIMLFVLLVPYFAPTIIGAVRKTRNTFAIFALNLLLGWTVIGWIVALVWALTSDASDGGARPMIGGARLCASCGKYSQPDAIFCAHCGHAFASTAG